MNKKYTFKATLCALASIFFLGTTQVMTGCAEVDLTIPEGEKGDKGDTGDPGKDGLNVYEKWLADVKAGKIKADNTDIASYFKWFMEQNSKKGNAGKSAYEVWKEAVEAGKIEKDGNVWPSNATTMQDYWKFLSGADGETGRTPQIIKGDDGKLYWSIDGKTADKTKPAMGVQGTNAVPVEVIIENGKFVIVDYNVQPASRIQTDQTANPTDGTSHTVTFDAKTGQIMIDNSPIEAKGVDKSDITITIVTDPADGKAYWAINGKIDKSQPAYGQKGDKGNNGAAGKSAYELWKEQVLSNKGLPHPKKPGQRWPKNKVEPIDYFYYLQGPDGADGENAVIPVILGKYNVIPVFFSGEFKEYVRPSDGGVLYQVYDKEGNVAGAGIQVNSLPGAKTFDKPLTTDNKGQILVPRELLPDAKPLSERRGISKLTVNGKEELSPANTLVPNVVNVRILLSETSGSFGSTYVRVYRKLQRSINGEDFKDFPNNYPTSQRDIEFGLLKDPKGEVTRENIALTDDDGPAQGIEKVSTLLSALKWDAFNFTWNYDIYRPVVIDADHEKMPLNEAYMKRKYNPSVRYAVAFISTKVYGQEAISNKAVEIPPTHFFPYFDFSSLKVYLELGKTIFFGKLKTDDIKNWPPSYKSGLSNEAVPDLPNVLGFAKRTPEETQQYYKSYTAEVSVYGKSQSGNNTIDEKAYTIKDPFQNPRFMSTTFFQGNSLRVNMKNIYVDYLTNQAYEVEIVGTGDNAKYFLKNKYDPEKKYEVEKTDQKPENSWVEETRNQRN